MLAVSLAHILPEALEQTGLATYAFIAGFIVIYMLEEFLTPHAHDHSHGDHSHEDPHEHYDHVAVVSFVAIFLHTVFDGLGIRAGFSISQTVGYSILAGVAIHQIPVSLSLAAIFRESKFKIGAQVAFLLLFAFAAPLGYGISDLLISSDSRPVLVGMVTAFAGGSLLYVSTADLLPVIHSQTKKKLATVAMFLIGVVAISSVKALETGTGEEVIIPVAGSQK